EPAVAGVNQHIADPRHRIDQAFRACRYGLLLVFTARSRAVDRRRVTDRPKALLELDALAVRALLCCLKDRFERGTAKEAQDVIAVERSQFRLDRGCEIVQRLRYEIEVWRN